LKKDYFVHESSYIDDNVYIGRGTKIWHFCHTIGCNVKIQNNVSIYEGVTLEDDVFCGPSCVFTNVDTPRSAYPHGSSGFLKTLVKRGCTIGANVTIICDLTLGAYSFIGAGAVVKKDVPNYALVDGSPARICGWMCECGTKLEFIGAKAKCAKCGMQYEKQADKIVVKIS